WNVYKSYKAGPVVEVDDPWGYGNSLEWATSCPPPLRNFDRMVRIRSERPAFDLKFPELRDEPPAAVTEADESTVDGERRIGGAHRAED
ncbi:MAG TPA: cytochrome ubiquinol oxidase subunit I, partial [Actinocatenispora sp.]